MRQYNKIGKCDRCLKRNKELIVTQDDNMIQGQICLKCREDILNFKGV